MPSKYRPQILGWFGDLDKGPYSLSLHDRRLIYANNNYCAFIRQERNDQIFYTCLYFVCIILGIILTIGMVLLIFGFDHELTLIGIIGFITSCFALNYAIPEFYQNAFSRRGSPILYLIVKRVKCMLMKVTFLTLKYYDTQKYFYNRKNVAYKSMIGMICMV